jgi:hypothetical protein
VVRKIGGAVVGVIAMFVVFLFAGGMATAMFHLKGLEVADGDHPSGALAIGAVAVFVIGALLAGLIGGYLASLISRWPTVVWIVAVAGAIDTFITSQLFANQMAVFLPCLVAVVAGSWVSGRLGKPVVAISAA